MTPFLPYLVSAVIAVGLGATAVALFYRPLFAVILDLCGTPQRARFWSVYLSAILILVPLNAVTFITTFGAGLSYFPDFLLRATFYALLGVTAALLGIGWGIWRPSSRLTPRAGDTTVRPGQTPSALTDETLAKF